MNESIRLRMEYQYSRTVNENNVMAYSYRSNIFTHTVASRNEIRQLPACHTHEKTKRNYERFICAWFVRAAVRWSSSVWSSESFAGTVWDTHTQRSRVFASFVACVFLHPFPTFLSQRSSLNCYALYLEYFRSYFVRFVQLLYLPCTRLTLQSRWLRSSHTSAHVFSQILLMLIVTCAGYSADTWCNSSRVLLHAVGN